jgi:hypothetical protein
MLRQFRTSVSTFALIVVTAACGGSKSPVAPDASQGTPGASTSATIIGSVKGATSPMLGAGWGAAISGVTVSVVGTSISSGLDAAGQFRLSDVPAGDVQLKFTGGGVDSTVPVPQVQTAQTITLVVAVSGSTASLEAERRSGASGAELEGRIESLPPTMAAGMLNVGGWTVTTQASTRFEQGGVVRTFADLEIGMRVHVTGQTSGSSTMASLITIQNTNTWIPVNVNGVIDSVTGSAASFQFNIGSRVIKGGTATEFFGDGSSAAGFADLKEGARVEVKGEQRDGFVQATRIHLQDVVDDDDDSDGQDQSASIQGTLTGTTGGATPTLTVGGTTVKTTADTEVRRRGDVQSLAQLVVGQTLHVVGTRQPDGSIIARKIDINDDQAGGAFEVEGAMGGVKGTCPALSFGIDGFSISTSASTTFVNGACTALKSGTKVLVNGTRNADGSVAATKVTTR